MSNMTPGYPTSEDFATDAISEYSADFGWHRDPGSGGQNYGVDLVAPDGSAVVDYEVHIKSDHNTKGSPAFYLAEKKVGPMNIPVGVHVGHRLTPGGFGGPGASFKGTVHMKIVSVPDWMVEFLKLITE